MSQPDAIIRIKNLRLRTFIGIKEEEIANLRQQVIDLTLEKKRLASKLNDIWKMSAIY